MTTPTAKPRMHHMDMLKGIAIFLVVMGHILTMCIRDIDAATIFKIIGVVHMPIFFFISGWFGYKADKDGRIKRPDLYTRAMQLIVPMIVVSSLWVLYYPTSGLQSPLPEGFDGLWTSDYKNGYWFTPTLFVIIAIYALIAPAILRLRSVALQLLTTFVIFVIAYITLATYVPPKYLNISSALLIIQYLPIYIFGAIARQHQQHFVRLTADTRVITAALILGTCLFGIAVWPWRFPEITENNPYIVPIALVLFQVALVIVAMNIAIPWAQKAFDTDRNRPAPIARIWEYLGQKSLGIYLLHYFFLFPLTILQPLMRDLALSIVPLTLVAAIGAAAVVATTITVIYIIDRSPLLSWLLTGNFNAVRRRK